VCRGGLQDVVGVLSTTDLLQSSLRSGRIEFATLVKPALFVPDSVTVMGLLELFKRNKKELALVVDEFGEIQGLVTLNDVLEAVVGDLPAAGDDEDEDVVRRADGSLLIDGAVSLDRLREALALDGPFPDEEDGAYHTTAGMVITQLGRLPKVSDAFEWSGLRFEVMDMDRHRVDRVLVSRLPGDAPSAVPEGPDQA
jgi:putative hemolysin